MVWIVAEAEELVAFVVTDTWMPDAHTKADWMLRLIMGRFLFTATRT